MSKKSLLTVLVFVFSVFLVGSAQAVLIDGLAGNALSVDAPVTNIYVNPGGLGDALIYGYYNVRGGNLNFLRVVNTGDTGIGAKIRFREGKNSNEVLDFFICLSGRDQWSAWIVDGGSGQPAILYYYDNDTPTYPDPQRNNDATDNLLAQEPFRTAAASSVTVDDTKEGYFEFIANVAWADTPGSGKVVSTPRECNSAVINLQGIGNALEAPNTLLGNHYIFNVANGAGTYAYNATALANFANASLRGNLGNDSAPRLSDATEGLNAVNFVLTKARQYATYDLQFDGQTTIINTFPTKRLSIAELVGRGPFRDDAGILSDGTIENRCEVVNLRIWDDAENTQTTSDDVSPRPSEEQFEKCNEVSLIVVGSGNPVLNTDLKDITLPKGEFELGWIMEDFTGIGRSTTVGDATTYGLPVISYELQGFLNGYYTHMLPLRYETVTLRYETVTQ